MKRIICLIPLFVFILIVKSYMPSSSMKQKETPQRVENTKTIDTIYTDFVIECKRREGFRDSIYVCPAGVKTIGYGQTGTNDTTITKMEATKQLHDALDKLYADVQVELPTHTRAQHLAVTLLVYNIGFKRLKSYRLWEKIKNKEPVYSHWKSIANYRNPATNKFVRSENLNESRKFEIWLYESDFKSVKDRTKQTLATYKNI